jgi:hypothetical protein
MLGEHIREFASLRPGIEAGLFRVNVPFRGGEDFEMHFG